MSILKNRTIAAGTPASTSRALYPLAVTNLLRAAITPSRRRKSYRVKFEDQYLWLIYDGTVFSTRASARTAICNWLWRGMCDLMPGEGEHTRQTELIGRFEVDGLWRVVEIVRKEVDRLLASGQLVIEETPWDEEPLVSLAG